MFFAPVAAVFGVDVEREALRLASAVVEARDEPCNLRGEWDLLLGHDAYDAILLFGFCIREERGKR